MELFINEKLGKIAYEIDDTLISDAVLIIAHGAGAGMNHSFMQSLAKAICNTGISTVRFNFPYMQQGKKAPGSPKDAVITWEKMIETISQLFHSKPLFIAGKSYGGRMASHLLSEQQTSVVKGIIYYGFPLHAPGRDSMDRASHLDKVKVPQLFIQGTKDKLANFEMITEVVNRHALASLVEIKDGDHSFNVPKSSGFTKESMIENLAKISSEWIAKIS